MRNFYLSGYNVVRGVNGTLLHDGLWNPGYWNGFMNWPQAYNVIIDHHEYQIFDPNLNAMNPGQHLSQVCASTKAFADSDKWEIVGE